MGNKLKMWQKTKPELKEELIDIRKDYKITDIKTGNNIIWIKNCTWKTLDNTGLKGTNPLVYI